MNKKLATFATWAEVLEHVARWDTTAEPTWYHAPFDVRPERVQVYRGNGDTVRVFPYGDADPFTADAGHLDRFRRADYAAAEVRS